MKKYILLTSFILLLFIGSIYAYSQEELDSANFLSYAGIIVNQENENEYKLDQNISRQEMLKVMMRMSWLDIVEKCEWKFSDISGWWCKYAEIALDNWMLAANDSFRPDDNISKIESLKMIFKPIDLERDDAIDWREWYVNKALYEWLIDSLFNDYDTSAKRWWIFNIAKKAIVSKKGLNLWTSTIYLSEDGKSIISEWEATLSIDDDRIFNRFKTSSQLCGDWNVAYGKPFCENKDSFKSQANFSSIMISPNKDMILFTIETDVLTPDKAIGVLNLENWYFSILTSYYLGNKSLGFSKNWNYFAYKSDCFEWMCWIYVIESSSLYTKKSINNFDTLDVRTYDVEFIRWVTDNIIEYKINWNIKQEIIDN